MNIKEYINGLLQYELGSCNRVNCFDISFQTYWSLDEARALVK